MDLDAEHRSLVSGFAGRASAPKTLLKAEGSETIVCSRIFVSQPARNLTSGVAFLNPSEELMETMMGRGILLWLLGVPIPVIILLWLFFGR
ncbi:MAG: hypothetical protein E8A46_11580 [Bradyrhizobium sp.]|uniref:hypothetical protein n=1 Tax=Bradyrhizobium sp. TaxID=376 RepID=UPI0012068352|nr:hypothetical protein [Bradyrhizobium sp.]THD53117.1 MAG: hypothetical protein E8A46_11580 [Bradyrhizobium sp.]